MLNKSERVDLIPDADELWKGIGGHFDSLSQILSEFIDNSISNFKANKLIMKTIFISLKELENKDVLVSIEDTGTGIKNLKSAFTLGSKDYLETPMNEHGFGMKHALATANLENDNWVVCTRDTEDLKNNIYKELKAPYRLENFKINTKSLNTWPGIFSKEGTYIEFICKKDMYKTLTKGLKGNHGFNSHTRALLEDLGFIYSDLIKEGLVTITVGYSNFKKTFKDKKTINALDPIWEKYIDDKNGSEMYDLGSGKVKIDYSFGIIKDSVDNRKYYKVSMNSSGLEIRLNGRVLEHNLFSSVWGIDRHNSYNSLLIKLNLITDDKDRLPITRTSKNGIREGDPKFNKLLEWVRIKLPKPFKNERHYETEIDLFKELEELKNTHIPEPKEVQRERPVFINLKDPANIDLFISKDSSNIIYEGKKNMTTILDVYQLKMYWDGCIIDNITPTQAFLIGKEHPASVKKMVEYVNGMLDLNKNNYNFSLKKWEDEGIIIKS